MNPPCIREASLLLEHNGRTSGFLCGTIDQAGMTGVCERVKTRCVNGLRALLSDLSSHLLTIAATRARSISHCSRRFLQGSRCILLLQASTYPIQNQISIQTRNSQRCSAHQSSRLRQHQRTPPCPIAIQISISPRFSVPESGRSSSKRPMARGSSSIERSSSRRLSSSTSSTSPPHSWSLSNSTRKVGRLLIGVVMALSLYGD